MTVLRAFVEDEPEGLGVWRQISDRRAENMRLLALELREAGGLRDDLSIDDPGDILWATNSPELYVLLVDERGWTPARYETWLAETWARILLAG